MTAGENWWGKAACHDVDPDIFFPHDLAELRAARSVCADCPVIDDCTRYADTHRFNGYPVTGVWGGKLRGFRRLGQNGVGPDADCE